MGKRGPPPKPSALKKAQGTYRPSRAPENEIEPPPGDPGCPDHLDALGQAEWKRIVPLLESVKVLTLADHAALEGYCFNYSMAVYYQKLAQAEPMVEVPLVTKGGGVEHVTKPNPASAEARRHWVLVRAFASEFGLTPSARTRVGTANPNGPDPKDKAAAFLFRNRDRTGVQGRVVSGGGSSSPEDGDDNGGGG
jgi:P27 family predicted phage terminase small subunit